MASKNFCDRCDGLIPTDDAYYGVGVTRQTDSYGHHKSFNHNGTWVDYEGSMAMVCEPCIKVVLLAVRGI